MKKLAIAALACAMPLTASAKGWGFSTSLANSSVADSNGYESAFRNLPTIDYRTQGWVIQFDALELFHGLSVEQNDARQLHLGVNAYKTVDKHPIKEDGLGGVLQPGLSVDWDSDSAMDASSTDIQLQMRLGARAQTKGGMGVGIYVVPGAGVAIHSEEIGMSVSGGLQIGVWRNMGE